VLTACGDYGSPSSELSRIGGSIRGYHPTLVRGNGSSAASKARYEYRVWGEDLATLEAQVERHGRNGRVRHTVETYLVAPANPGVNPKIRGGLLDVKVLVRLHEGLEQWEPRFKATFPLPAAAVRSSLFPLLGLAAPELDRREYSHRELLDEVAAPHAGLVVVEIGKRRRSFTIDGCLAEIATVVFGDRSLQTVAIEGVDSAEVYAIAERIGIDAYENVSYPVQIGRLSDTVD
jgi:hypothetical protein